MDSDASLRAYCRALDEPSALNPSGLSRDAVRRVKQLEVKQVKDVSQNTEVKKKIHALPPAPKKGD